jgi:hypothetical protein
MSGLIADALGLCFDSYNLQGDSKLKGRAIVDSAFFKLEIGRVYFLNFLSSLH